MDYFFDIWCGSYNDGYEPMWFDSKAPLRELVGLSMKGLIISGCVDGQDDYVWKLTEKGCLVGAALNRLDDE